jgi:NAD kinase
MVTSTVTILLIVGANHFCNSLLICNRGKRVFVEPAVHKDELTIFEPFDEKDPARGIDMCICLGGDGTLLHANSLFQSEQGAPPTIAFSLGTLGFLTPFQVTEYPRHLSTVLQPCRLNSLIHCPLFALIDVYDLFCHSCTIISVTSYAIMV